MDINFKKVGDRKVTVVLGVISSLGMFFLYCMQPYFWEYI